MRFRTAFSLLGFILVTALWLLTDPDLGLVTQLSFGAGLIATLVLLSKGILGPSLLYLTRKAMFDYKVADMEELGKKAAESSVGAGLYAIAIALMCLAFSVVIIGFIHA